MKTSLLFITLAAAVQAALAQSATPPSGDRALVPPPEAVAACKGKSEGTEVSFTLRDGVSRKGVCKTINGTLAVAPPDGPRPSSAP